jgi:hypothetical protein
MQEHIQYDYHFDNHFEELKQAELMGNRLQVATQLDPFLGKYYSIEYVRKQVLMQSDTEYDEITKQMDAEIAEGKIPDPIHTNLMNAASLEVGAMPPPPPAPAATSKPKTSEK